jgi:hypothetical protein
MQFHTYKLKEERIYRVMLKNIHYSINPEEIETEIENLRHTATNIWNICVLLYSISVTSQ